MSDALDFLAKARPDAMPHYFAFLKQCGTRLDPKTRDLISVITKVHAQTERGFRQYVKRALKDGCSVEEVLDALLKAGYCQYELKRYDASRATLTRLAREFPESPAAAEAA